MISPSPPPPPWPVGVGARSGGGAMPGGVSPGQTVPMPKQYVRLSGTRATGRSFDDRVDTPARLIALRRLDRAALKHQVIFIWSVREEIGLEGAAAAAAALGTTPRRVHAIDTFVSADSPIELPNFAVAPIGRGAVARALDNSSITPPAYVDSLVQVARARGVALQVGTTNGGNDGSEFTPYGAAGAPTRWPRPFAHCPAAVIDLVVVNLYPFRETVAKPGVSFEQAIEQIDIGGPSMLRSAAKNHQDVLVVVDPDDYPKVAAAIKDMARGVSPGLRKELAAKVFAHTAAYDAAIHGYLTKDAPGWPERITLALERRLELRYGENPHQAAALYATAEPGIRDLEQLSGKELSFNNLLDLDAGLLAVAPWSGRGADRAACAIIKHTTPCGIALGRSPREAYERALATDRTSAFGSVIAYNVTVDRAAAEAMRELFVEVVVAPAFAEDAVRVFHEKKNLRVVRLPAGEATGWDWKRIRGGFLAQERSRLEQVMDETRWKVMTKRAPTDVEWRDLRFAWGAAGALKSNAILLARDEAAIGIGAGQTSRVDASFLAIHKARQRSEEHTSELQSRLHL